MRAGALFAALLTLVAALCVQAAPAAAQDEYSTLLDAGFDKFDARDFSGALELFQQAAEVRRTGEVMFNIAACHEYLGQLEESVAALKEAIQLGVSAALQERAQRKIDTLEARLKPDEPEPTPEPVTEPEPTPVQQADCPSVDPEWAARQQTLRGLGAGLLIGGGAAVGAGGVFWGLAWNENQQLQQAETVEEKQQHIDAVNDFALAGDITAGVGAAVAVTGLVISLVSCRCEPGGAADTVAFAPAVLPLPDGGFAFAIGGEF